MSENLPTVVIARFQTKVYNLVEDPSTDSFISWGKDNNSFVIWNQEELVRSDNLWSFHCLKFSQFRSLLKIYGFIRIKKGSGEVEYGNEDFVRGQPERLRVMNRNAMRRLDAKDRAKEKAEKAAKRLERLQIQSESSFLNCFYCAHFMSFVSVSFFLSIL